MNQIKYLPVFFNLGSLHPCWSLFLTGGGRRATQLQGLHVVVPNLLLDLRLNMANLRHTQPVVHQLTAQVGQPTLSARQVEILPTRETFTYDVPLHPLPSKCYSYISWCKQMTKKIYVATQHIRPPFFKFPLWMTPPNVDIICEWPLSHLHRRAPLCCDNLAHGGLHIHGTCLGLFVGGPDRRLGGADLGCNSIDI